MALVNYSAQDTRYGLAPQTTFGTAAVDGAAVIELNADHFEVQPDIKVESKDQAHGFRGETYGNYLIRSTLALPKFSIGGEVNLNDFAHFLYAFDQVVSEGASTPFAKVITPHATQPDFSVNAGHFFTIFERDPLQAYKTKDCIVQAIEMSFKEGGYLTFKADIIGRGNPAASTPSGTWTASSIAALASGAESPLISYFSRFTVNFGGGAVSLVLSALNIKLQHEIIGLGGAAGTDFQSFAIGKSTGTFDYTVLKDANFSTARTNLLANTAVAVRLGRGNATAGTDAGDFDIIHTGRLTEVPTEKNVQSLGCHIKGAIVAPDSSTAGHTFTLAEAVDRAW